MGFAPAVVGAASALSSGVGWEEAVGEGFCAEAGGRPMYSFTRVFCSPVLPLVEALREVRVWVTSRAGCGGGISWW